LSKWAGKYVIGLTGNIGTGKSVVRRMLEHLGAYGIDADTLGHRAIARGAPGYQPIVTYFGRYVLAPSGEVDRARLGRIVFSDPDALETLEKIIHPLVEQAVDLIVQRAIQPVVVIEAIKLIETAGLVRACDSVWVTTATPENQLERLMKYRKINEAEARQRMASQPNQQQKIFAASVVIKNDGSFEETWRQVVSGWKKYVPVARPGGSHHGAAPCARCNRCSRRPARPPAGPRAAERPARPAAPLCGDR
jgi:dephospho-CoA kinase